MDDMGIFGPYRRRFGLRQLPFNEFAGASVRAAVVLIAVLAFCGGVSAEDNGTGYKVVLRVGPDDFLGACNTSRVNALELSAVGECVGNFLNPTLPNPLNILKPVTGDGLKAKLRAIDVFNKEDYDNLGFSGALSKLVNAPIVLFAAILELIVAALLYVLVFAFRFIFVYVFYVSLGYQAVMLYLDSNSRGLEDVRKIQVTVFIMGLASILTLSIGGGWISW